LHYQSEMNRLFERDQAYRSDSTIRRINSAAEDLVEYLFFSGEFHLTSPVTGNSTFIEQFANKALRDDEGRSLRDLELNQRLLRYPCSYLVYSESFLSLPEPVLTIVKTRMLDVLAGKDESEKFLHLSADDRKNILEILTQTHPLFCG